MNKIALLGDVHVGCHNSSTVHHSNMSKFFENFFEYIDVNGIKDIIQLGDLFDVRKHINTWSLNWFRTNILNPIRDRNVHMTVLLGNHDIFYRESLQVSSVEEILQPYRDWFTVVKEPTTVEYSDHLSFLLVPWVCKENAEIVSNAIANSKSQYCAGHFEFDGFELFRGHVAKTHYKHDAYKRFARVFSGHYHHMNARDNVLYTGTPYELTWQDWNTPKGFFVLDDSGQCEMITNPHTMYTKVNYSSIDTIDKSSIVDHYVRLTIDAQITAKERENVLDKLQSMCPISLKVIESATAPLSIAENTVQYSQTDDIIRGYIENVDLSVSLDRTELNTVMMNLFAEASHAR